MELTSSRFEAHQDSGIRGELCKPAQCGPMARMLWSVEVGDGDFQEFQG